MALRSLLAAGLLLPGAALLWLAAPWDGFLLGGIQVNEPDHGVWLSTLEAAGMNAVQVTVYARQGDWDSENLWFDATDEAVIHEIRTARRLGLEVALVLRVALDHAFERNAFLWHGMIMPREDHQVEAWFRRYRSFVRQWAEIARREGVDLLAVGSELNALASTRPVDELPALEEYYLDPEKQAAARAETLRQGAEMAAAGIREHGQAEYPTLEAFVDARAGARQAWARAIAFGGGPGAVEQINRRRLLLAGEWERVIAESRALFPGELTFAANFDQYREVGFWSHLDLIGINAYFELREVWRPEPTPAELSADLRRGWRRVLAEIDDFRARLGRPGMEVVFTELGYTTAADSTIRPWAQDGVALVPTADGGEKLLFWDRRPERPSERALAVAALYEEELALERELLRGVLWWKLSTRPEHAEIEPFVLVLGSGGETGPDPLLEELRRFRMPRRVAKLWRAVFS